MTAVTTENDEANVTTTSSSERPSRAAARRAVRAEMPGYKAAAELAESGALDGLFAQIDAGEIGAGHTVTALYEIVPATTGDAAPSSPTPCWPRASCEHRACWTRETRAYRQESRGRVS